MNIGRLLLQLLLALMLAGPSVGLIAQEPESTPNPQPEEENPPVIRVPQKKVHRRPARLHSTQSDRVEIGKSVVIAAGESVSELVVIAGDATVDGTVEGSVVVLSGTARINGHIKQDLVTVFGAVDLGQDARVGQDVVVVGGPLKVNPQAEIGGQRTVVALGHVIPDFMWLQKWLTKGLFLARPFPPQVKWVWVVAALFLLLYLALAVMFPRPVRACVDALERQPVASLIIGTVMAVLLGPLLFLLVVSVAGLAVIPFLFCAVIAAALFGKVTVYSYAGQQVGRQIHLPEASLPLVLTIGATLFYLIYMVPVLGFAVWGIVTLFGIGAVLLAAFGSFQREERPAYVPAEPVSPTPPLMTPSQQPGMASSEVPRSASLFAAGPPPILSPADMALLARVGFWRRLCATILDFVLLALLIHLTGPLFLLVWIAYHVAMWAWKGTTVGGIVMGMKIVRLDGQPLDFAVALVRSLSAFFSAFALFLGFFWAGWDREKQAWHDKIAGTVVVRVPKGVPLI